MILNLFNYMTEKTGINMDRFCKNRAWDKTNNRMYYQGTTCSYTDFEGEGWTMSFHSFLRNILQNNPYCEMIPMQPTGLYDKNGVLIYEGDVLKTTDKNHHPDDPESILDVVKWYDGYFGICDGEMGLDKFMLAYSEIIGNIYENPELLESL